MHYTREYCGKTYRYLRMGHSPHQRVAHILVDDKTLRELLGSNKNRDKEDVIPMVNLRSIFVQQIERQKHEIPFASLQRRFWKHFHFPTFHDLIPRAAEFLVPNSAPS